MHSMHELLELAANAASPETRLLHLAELRQAVDAAMVSAFGQIDDSPGPVMLDGSVDAAQWLAARSDIHPAEAKSLAGLAHDLPDMPATGEAVNDGRIGPRRRSCGRRRRSMGSS